jgi:cytoskeletal protein CcmA (bactofilin family)
MTNQYLGDEADAVDLIEPGQPFSRVDRYSRFDGRYEAMQNLVVEGSCSGEIDCRGTLVIAEGAVVNAKITARDIRVAGTVDGDLECSGKFELLPSARASGSVVARQIIVHEGGQYDGEMQMTGPSANGTEPEVPEPPVAQQPAPPTNQRTPAAPPRTSNATVPATNAAATATNAGAPAQNNSEPTRSRARRAAQPALPAEDEPAPEPDPPSAASTGPDEDLKDVPDFLRPRRD